MCIIKLMRKFIATLLIFVFWALPGFSLAILGPSAPGLSGQFLHLCAIHPVACGIASSVALFMKVFGGKLKCLFGSEQDIFKAGFTPQTVVQNSAYDNLLGVKSLTDTQGNFGGQILIKQKCKCGAKLGVKDVIMVGPPRQTMVAITSGTKVYDYGSFDSGNWVLGRSTGQVVCRVPKALGIEEIGTSR